MTTMHNTPSEEGGFGAVPMTEERLEDLANLVHSQSRLQKAGYVMWQLGRADLERKKRCGRCSKGIRPGHEKQKSRALSVKLAPTIAHQIATGAFDEMGDGSAYPGRQSSHSRTMSLQPSGTEVTDRMRSMTLGDGNDKKKNSGPPMNCRFHPGSIMQRQWTCCHKNISSPPCAAEQFHTTRIYKPGELEANWQYFPTPHPEAHLSDHPFAPPEQQRRASSRPAPVAAIVIDCEMGVAQTGESELIRVSAIDFFTRKVLVDSLVWPDVKMAHFNTRYSGVSRHGMEAARRTRKTLQGRAGARQALWRFVGPQTIVVGHSGNSDLMALRWIHPRVIDTLILEMRIQPREERQDKKRDDESGAAGAEEPEQPSPSPESSKSQKPSDAENSKSEKPEEPEKPKYPGLSLKALAADRLKREIQIRGQGHDSLEDALATRDLLLWHLIHKPQPPIPSFD